MGAVAVFEYAKWALVYPELAATVNAPLANEYFVEATLYFANDGSGPVGDPERQRILLGMLTAHIAKLRAPLNGQPSPDLVGRISDASEGSVSVSAQLELKAPSAQWYMQTKYGLAFWQATATYRTAHYRPSGRRGAGAIPGSIPFWGQTGGRWNT